MRHRFPSSAGLLLAIALPVSGPIYGQSVISAHSGVIEYVEGMVTVDGQTVEPRFSQFPELKNDQTLSTEEGRAEILLTPGVVLRLGANSSVRMVSNLLTDTRVEFQNGAALVEAAEIFKDNAISVLDEGKSVFLLKRGTYRFDSAPAPRVRVYDGEAVVASAMGHLRLKRFQEAWLDNAVPIADKFSSRDRDDLDGWSQLRDSYVPPATVSGAPAASGGGYSWYGSGWGWSPFYTLGLFGSFGYGLWNPWGPFGGAYGFYSPAYIYYPWPGIGGVGGVLPPPVAKPAPAPPPTHRRFAPSGGHYGSGGAFHSFGSSRSMSGSGGASRGGGGSGHGR